MNEMRQATPVGGLVSAAPKLSGPEKALANYAWMVEYGEVPTRPNRPAELQLRRYYEYERWRAMMVSTLRAILARRGVPPRERFAYYPFAERVARHQRIYTNLMLARFTEIEIELAAFRGMDRAVLEDVAQALAEWRQDRRGLTAEEGGR
jgi:hypothetical protein